MGCMGKFRLEGRVRVKVMTHLMGLSHDEEPALSAGGTGNNWPSSTQCLPVYK